MNDDGKSNPGDDPLSDFVGNLERDLERDDLEQLRRKRKRAVKKYWENDHSRWEDNARGHK